MNDGFEKLSGASAKRDELPATGVSGDFEGVPLASSAAHAQVADRVVFGPGLEDQEVAVLSHAKVVEAVLSDDVFESDDRKRVG